MFPEPEDEMKQIVPIKTYTHCCDGMMMALADELIGYGLTDDEPFKIKDDDRATSFNIYQFDKEAKVTEATPINFCPFCGERIEIEHA